MFRREFGFWPYDVVLTERKLRYYLDTCKLIAYSLSAHVLSAMPVNFEAFSGTWGIRRPFLYLLV